MNWARLCPHAKARTLDRMKGQIAIRCLPRNLVCAQKNAPFAPHQGLLLYTELY
jgi:hypothetical protein